MIIWIVPTLFFAGVVLLIDFIARQKKWHENTKTEKIGLTFLWNNQQVFESNDNLTIQNGTIEVTSSKRLITAIYSANNGDLTIEDCTDNKCQHFFL